MYAKKVSSDELRKIAADSWPEVIDRLDQEFPNWASAQSLCVVRDRLASLHHCMESSEAPGISWENPWVPLRFTIDWDWQRGEPLNGLPEAAVQRGSLPDAARRMGEYQVQRERRAVLQGLAEGLAFPRRDSRRTNYTFLTDSEGTALVHDPPDNEKRSGLLELKQPFTMGDIEAGGPEPVYGISRNRRRAGRELGRLLRFEGDLDGRLLSARPIVRIHPMAVDVDEHAAYFPIDAGLLCSLLPTAADRQCRWIPDAPAGRIVWERVFARRDDLIGDVRRPSAVLERRTSVMSPVPVPRQVMPYARALRGTRGLGRMFAGYAEVPDLDLGGEMACQDAERIFWSRLEQRLETMGGRWRKETRADHVRIALEGIQVDEARRQWMDFATSLNAMNGGPGIEARAPGIESTNRMEHGGVVVETEIVLWPPASLADGPGPPAAPVHYRKDSSPGYVELREREGKRAYFAQGWLWIPRGEEREGFRIGGLPRLLFPEGRAAVERIKRQEQEAYAAELNRIVQTPGSFQDEDARVRRELEAAAERVRRELAGLSLYDEAHDLILYLLGSFHRHRDAWIAERARLADGREIDTSPWRILCLEPNDLRVRLDPQGQWGTNWRAQLFKKLEALTTFERQTRTADGRTVDAGDRLLTRVLDGKRGISEGTAPDGDSGLGLTRRLKEGGAFPIDAFFVEISVDFMERLFTWVVDEEGRAHWGLDAATAARGAHLALAPDDTKGARAQAAGIKKAVQAQPYFDHSPRLQTLMNLEDWPDSMKHLAWAVLQERTPNYELRPGANGRPRRTRKKNRLGGKERLERIEGRNYVAYNGKNGNGYRIETWIGKAGYEHYAEKHSKRLQLWVENVRKLCAEIGLQIRFRKGTGDTGHVLGVLEQYRRTPELGSDAVVQIFLPHDLERQIRDRLAEAGIDAIDEGEALDTILTPSQPHGLSPADIRLARTKAGWKQADLAEKAGVSKMMISHWETGKKPVPPERVHQLTRILASYL